MDIFKRLIPSRYHPQPAFIIAMRDFIVQGRRKINEDRSTSDRFRIDTGEINQDRLEVNWECETGAPINEISYLIIGEAV